MTAYCIAYESINDPNTFEEYRRQVMATLEAHGGRFIVRGGATECVEGAWDAERTVVIEFPSMDQARAWYHGEAYQELAAIRREASTADFVLVEGVPDDGPEARRSSQDAGLDAPRR